MNSFKFPLRVVFLNYPIKHWKDRLIQNFFCQVVHMKISGYWSHFNGSKMLPVDQTDLIGTNIVVCYDTPFGLVPVMGYRSVELSRCEYHRISFPPKTILETSGMDTTELNSILDNVKNNNRSICYKSSWTKSEHMPDTKEAAHYMRNILTSIAVNYTQETGIDEWMSCGAVKYKTDEYFDYLGMRRITPEFKQFSFFDNDAVMFHMKDLQDFSVEAKKIAQEMYSYWENRIVLGEEFTLVNQIKKAA